MLHSLCLAKTQRKAASAEPTRLAPCPWLPASGAEEERLLFEPLSPSCLSQRCEETDTTLTLRDQDGIPALPRRGPWELGDSVTLTCEDLFFIVAVSPPCVMYEEHGHFPTLLFVSIFKHLLLLPVSA